LMLYARLFLLDRSWWKTNRLDNQDRTKLKF